MRIAELAGRRVAVWGAGREGHAALAALRRCLPETPLALFCTPVEALDFVDDPLITCHAAAPDAAALAGFEVVLKSPGISRYRPELLAAEARGTVFTSGTALWFAEHPQARVIGVTGTKGKSTVASLIAHLLRARGRRTALAGNIGLPLLELLAPDTAPEAWVVELSSFQTREAGPLEVGVINNLHEEHLDWHGSRERYAADKLALADAAATLLVNAMQPELLARTAAHPRRRVFGDAAGWHVREGALWRGAERLFDWSQARLHGRHNALNACAALAALEAFGEDARAAVSALADFRPLPHRLQELGRRDGCDWIDDSIATTPAATLAALASLPGRQASVLVGGFDRGLDWEPFVRAIRTQPPRAVITMGAAGPRIHALLAAAQPGCALESAETLAEAVARARRLTPAGGVVLLSPGAPSFDQFANYMARGNEFARLAGFDPAAIGTIPGIGIA